MTELALALIAIVLLTLRGVFGWAMTGEIKGALFAYFERRVREAGGGLPEDIADDQVDEWLNELESLGDRPLSAWRFVRGLGRAAAGITCNVRPEASQAGRARPGYRPRRITAAAVAAAVGVSFSGTEQAAGFMMLICGCAYAGRVALHLAQGYWTVLPTRRRLMAVDATIVIGLLGGAAYVLVAAPPPALVAGVAISLYAAILLNAAAIVLVTERAGLPRGGETISATRMVIAIRTSADRLSTLGAQMRVLDRLFDAPHGRVSPLVVAAAYSLLVMTFVSILDLLFSVI